MIRVATREDVPAMAGVIARAFQDDPVAVFAHPRDGSRERRMRFFMEGRGHSLVDDELCFCAADNGSPAGAALWAAPDRWHVPPREQLRTLRLVNTRAPFLVAGFARMEKLHPREPHYYLAVIGVDPSAQGRGIGTKLLAPMLERCDREGVPAYLESSKERNIAFYARHGFRVTGDFRFPRGPTMWPMWRDPR